MLLKCVLLSYDIKLFHKKSTCDYSLYSELFPYLKSKEIFIGSDTYFAIRFPESTTQLVAVNRKLRPVSCVSWLPFDMGKILKGKKKTHKPNKKNLHKETTPHRGMKGGKKQSACQCADLTADKDTEAWSKGQILFICIFTQARNNLKPSLKKRNMINSQVIAPFLDCSSVSLAMFWSSIKPS